MDWLLIFTSCVCSFCLSFLIYLYRKFDKQKAMLLPKEAVHHADDSIKSAEEIGKFLKERADVSWIGFSGDIVSSTDADEIYRGRAAGVVALIRMVHRLGYEFVVREYTGRAEDEMKTESQLAQERKGMEKCELINNKVREILGEK